MARPNPAEEARIQKILKINQQRISPLGVQQRQAQIDKAQTAINAKRDKEAMGKK